MFQLCVGAQSFLFRNGRCRRRLAALMGIPFLLASCHGASVDPHGTSTSVAVPAGSASVGDAPGEGHLRDMLMVNAVEVSEPLPPGISIERFSAAHLSVPDLMRQLLRGKPISIVADDDIAHVMVTAVNVSGRLPAVIDELAETVGFFYLYHDGNLRLVRKRRFIVSLPPIESAFTGMADAVRSMGGSAVAVDQANRLLAFTAGRRAWRQIDDYMKMIRRDRVMITWKVGAWSVDLNGNVRDVVDFIPMARPMVPRDPTTMQAQLSKAGAVIFDGSPSLSMLSGGHAGMFFGEDRRIVVRLGDKSAETQNTSSGVSVDIEADLLTDGNSARPVNDGLMQAAVSINIVRPTFDEGFKVPGLDAVLPLPRGERSSMSAVVRLRPGECALLTGLFRAAAPLRRESVFLLCPTMTPFSPSLLSSSPPLPSPGMKAGGRKEWSSSRVSLTPSPPEEHAQANGPKNVGSGK